MKALAIAVAAGATAALFAATPAQADEPEVFTEQETFVDRNPCTGLEHEIMVETTFRVHAHDDRLVVHRSHALSTTSGFSGRGTGSYIFNGNLESFRVNDMLTNPDGDRIRAHLVFVFDLRAESARVDTFTLTCV